MSQNISTQFNKEYGVLPIRSNSVADDEMALSEHIEEFSQRFIFCLILLGFFTIVCFADVKDIVKLVQAPADGIKFLQFSPGEYFFASVKIAFFSGILISSPLILSQILLYTLPGLTKKERDILLPMTVGSGLLFGIGLWFSYSFLIPAALKFFIAYGADIVEPFWSFEQYFNFVAVLIFSTGLAFQVPVIQIVIGLLGIVSGKTMLKSWKYVVVVATILGAIITPSTDPITQILLSGALLALYLSGASLLIFLNK